MIDLTLQKLDGLHIRVWRYLKYFFDHFIKDKFTCPLMVLWALALGVAVICYLIEDKNAVQIAGPTITNLI